MKKQSGFKLKSGNKPSPTKFFKGFVGNISKKIGKVFEPVNKALGSIQKEVLGERTRSARGRGTGRNKQFDDYINQFKS